MAGLCWNEQVGLCWVELGCGWVGVVAGVVAVLGWNGQASALSPFAPLQSHRCCKTAMGILQ